MSTAAGWTFDGFLHWAFGPQVLARLSGLVTEARQRVAFLREVEGDPVVVHNLRSLIRELRGEMAGRRWNDDVATADVILGQLGAGPLTATALYRLDQACLSLQRSFAARARATEVAA